jgi:hypothetical protein
MRFVNYLYTPLVNDTGATALLNLSGTNTLRLLMTGVQGQDNRKTMINYMMMVQAPIAVLSCDTVNGTYTAETGAVIDVNARTITIPKSGNTRFYRIGSNVPIAIKSISASGANVILSL